MKEVLGGVRIVTLKVSDLTKARAFWVDRFGLLVTSEEPGKSVTLNAGSFRLGLEQGPGGGGATIVFRARNLGWTAKELDERGIAYEKRGEKQHATLIARDPDGYELVFGEQL